MITPEPPAGLRRIAIDPLSRVEGHGKVTLLVDDRHRVVQARLHIVEFRGFERFIVGRPYWEVPVMVQRLCGICPVSHHLAANKALDAALGTGPLTATATAVRRLMHYGQVLQSHALHFFHLSSPDLLFGIHAPVERRHLLAVAAEHPDIARDGVLLRAYGQELIRVTAGRRIHGTGAVPGGVNRHVPRDERDRLRAQVPDMIARCERAVALVMRLHARDRALYESFADVPSPMMTLVEPDGTLALYDGRLRVVAADGGPMIDGADPSRYLDLIEETVRPWTYMKFPYLRALGEAHGGYRVGPLARLQACDRLGTPRADAHRAAFLAQRSSPVHAALATHTARLIEMLHAMEVAAALLDDDALVDGPLAVPVPVAARGAVREGVGVIEAPRGTLIHDYAIGDDDLVSRCNLVVSTTHNNHSMHEALRAVAAAEHDVEALDSRLLDRIEVAIRAYDPCLSCATHALGAMPLMVELADPGGRVRARAWRDADGTRGREDV